MPQQARAQATKIRVGDDVRRHAEPNPALRRTQTEDRQPRRNNRARRQHGRLTLRDPKSSVVHTLELDGRSTFTPAVARLLRDEYGVNPSEVATSGPHN